MAFPADFLHPPACASPVSLREEGAARPSLSEASNRLAPALVMSALSQLQALLRDLFQLDLADLDFGLYRLLRLKREEVEAFLTEQLPRRVDEAFQSMAGEERTVLEKEISDLASRIQEEIAEDALLPDGEVKPEYREIKAKAARDLLATYEAKRRHLQSVQATEAQKAEVFNHLYAFFSRYYEAGDFIPRRRYGARETYAVPYNGEETFFHWANKDQHYVKTSEAFRDYAFTVETLGGPCRVRFVLTEASLPPGNTKGDTRYFFPLPDQATWDKESRTFHLPFHYRLPTEEEIEKYGKNSRLQEAILQGALPKILKAVPGDTLRAALSALVEEKDDQAISLLLKRLRHFTRRNTTDYFIHRDLEGFLKRELEFYLKDQVLHLGDLDGDLEAKRRTLRVIRQLAEEIIAFQAQIENVQKRLFEKRKFVLRTDYLVPIKEVPRELWKEVLANKAQIEAWKTLFATPTLSLKSPQPPLYKREEGVEGGANEHFLEEHPTLVVNTAHFGPELKERLLVAFDDLDEVTDGLLIHAENSQALRFLERKYAGRVKCIYIDPPYNTGSDEFIYKDRYRHSSWLAMMEERLIYASKLFEEDGVIFISIDDFEVHRLRELLDGIPGIKPITTFVRKRRASSAMSSDQVSVDHEYALACARPEFKAFRGLGKDYASYSNPDNDPRGDWTLGDLTVGMGKDLRPRQFYTLVNPRTGRKYPPNPNRVWAFTPESMEQEIDRVVFPDDQLVAKLGLRISKPMIKRYRAELKSTVNPVSTWMNTGKEVVTTDPDDEVISLSSGLNTEGTKELQNLGLEYPYPKPTSLVKNLIDQVLFSRGLACDFFAGSGTTGHAVMNLNREDGGRRKFILVEMDTAIFEKVLKPRIQKVMYAPEWKDGKPKRLPTKEEVERTPRLVKVLRLEGYEDALHNLATDETLKREAPRARAHKERLGEDAYRLSYLVRLPLEANASMLNLSALEHPFRYTLEVLTEDGPGVETVNLVETFNFLYGLHVERLETWVNDKDGRTYRVVKGRNRDGQRVLVLWRDIEGLDPVVERHFLEAKLKAEAPFDEMLINGDTATPGIRSLDGLFKRLLEEGER